MGQNASCVWWWPCGKHERLQAERQKRIAEGKQFVQSTGMKCAQHDHEIETILQNARQYQHDPRRRQEFFNQLKLAHKKKSIKNRLLTSKHSVELVLADLEAWQEVRDNVVLLASIGQTVARLTGRQFNADMNDMQSQVQTAMENLHEAQTLSLEPDVLDEKKLNEDELLNEFLVDLQHASSSSQSRRQQTEHVIDFPTKPPVSVEEDEAEAEAEEEEEEVSSLKQRTAEMYPLVNPPRDKSISYATRLSRVEHSRRPKTGATAPALFQHV
jgi:hypothetical protein